MKRILIMSSFMMVLMVSPFGCMEDDDESSPAGEGTLNVSVTYNGNFGTDVDGSRAGEMINYVYLYRDMGETAANEYSIIYPADPMTEGAIDTNGGIYTFDNVANGDYYIIAFYDYRGSGSNATDLLNRNDRYALYDGDSGSPLREDAVTVNITGNTSTVDMTIEADWILQDDNLFITTIP